MAKNGHDEREEKKAATAGRSGKNCMHKTNTVELI